MATQSCRDARGLQLMKTDSSRRSTSMAATHHDDDGGRSRYHGHVWSTDASRHVGAAEKWRSRSADARSRSKCRGCARGGESIETLEVRLLSPDSGAIVFSETPENDLATTVRTATDWPDEVGIHPQYEWNPAHVFDVEGHP